MRLAGKVALITGGASGMGQSEATIFAREGARVVVADVLEFEARQVVEKIAAAGGQARFVKLDVRRSRRPLRTNSKSNSPPNSWRIRPSAWCVPGAAAHSAPPATP